VVADDIEASHVALFTFTGSDVIGVFQTLSAGKAGQLVPGNVGPATRVDNLVDGGLDRDVALEITGVATSTSPVTITAAPILVARRERSGSRERDIQMVYPGFATCRARLSKSCSASQCSEAPSHGVRNFVFVESMDVALRPRDLRL
jgi:hypothetical protein